ncbi:MAG: glycoside hydrolase family 2 protein [Gemmatimonadota bacterium]
MTDRARARERSRPVTTGLPAGAVSWRGGRGRAGEPAPSSVSLTSGWQLASTEPGACATPADVQTLLAGHGGTAAVRWRRAVVPGTVAVAVGPADLDAHEPYDALDWWYRVSVPRAAFPDGGAARQRVRFDGLATLAEVWWNGERVLESRDMFVAHEIDVTDLVEDENELMIVFRSLAAALSARRPRPRWKTKLVEQQQIRWFRTTLLGRVPGWTPRIAPVGPWRAVWAESVAVLDVETLDVRARIENGVGVVEVSATVSDVASGGGSAAGGTATGSTPVSAVLRVAGERFPLAVEPGGTGRLSVRGTARVRSPALWWPATHGEPALHECSLEIRRGDDVVLVDCGRVGFRDVRVDGSEGDIRFVVNGVPVFCRGSCWTTNDIVSLVGDPERMRRVLGELARAHGNMIRVGGTMVYESDDFYRACDEFGIMVWQDFMFANMDYPVADADFAALARTEAEQQLRRLGRHASVVAWCGGSEVEQQAAMFGAPREIWSNDFFAETLPALVAEHAPGTPYWPSTPTGGALPFHVGTGLTHYYGIGAYRRPLEDVRLAGVKFTPECLGFSHVPRADNLRLLTPAGAVPPHHPVWKRGVPRDTGPGWDFEDVRDHYLERLYDVHAATLRSDDLERYLALSRVVSGEAMAYAFAEWRRAGDPCGGALTWFWNDFRPGAGWGVVDSDGVPKAAYYHLRRAWAPRCVRLLDRGLDGLVAHVVNDGSTPLVARLELLVLARGRAVVAEGAVAVTVPPASSREVGVEETLGHFLDSTYAYRFGPPRHEAVVARLVSSDADEVVSEDVYRPIRSAMTGAGTPPATSLVRAGPDELTLTLTTDTLLYDVRIDVRDHLPDDDHFCLTPGRPRTVRLRRAGASGRPLEGYVEALNLLEAVRLTEPE